MPLQRSTSLSANLAALGLGASEAPLRVDTKMDSGFEQFQATPELLYDSPLASTLDIDSPSPRTPLATLEFGFDFSTDATKHTVTYPTRDSLLDVENPSTPGELLGLTSTSNSTSLSPLGARTPKTPDSRLALALGMGGARDASITRACITRASSLDAYEPFVGKYDWRNAIEVRDLRTRRHASAHSAREANITALRRAIADPVLVAGLARFLPPTSPSPSSHKTNININIESPGKQLGSMAARYSARTPALAAVAEETVRGRLVVRSTVDTLSLGAGARVTSMNGTYGMRMV